MPRVANPPAAGNRRPAASRQILSTPHKQSPIKLQFNDDRVEKAERLKSRQVLREIEQNEMRAAAAASPMRKRLPAERDGSESPRTPRSNAAEARRRAAGGHHTNSPGSLNVVSHGATVTPLKRAPILANFEEWMKLATDNKINANNSWNFALIDYFHDMSLLREGDGVNFQKASCTLDGCVKIYTSRVDSVSTEAGRLLSGLADSGENKKKKGGEGEEGEGEEGDEDEEEGEDGVKKKVKKKVVRSHEATLAPSFASLQLKKLELEFAVDPLFKKASADFDEGGAKGLLLNHLSIDGDGRIVFDSSDDAGDVMLSGGETTKPKEREQDQEDGDESQNRPKHTDTGAEDEQPPDMEGDAEIDLNALATKFFADLSILDDQDICPSMKCFKLGDPSGDLSIPFLKAPDDWKSPQKRHDEQQQPKIDLNLADQTGIFLDGTNAVGFDDDDNDGILGGFDMPDNVGFGEGGEAWAKDAALEPMLRVTNGDDAREPGDDEDEEGGMNGYTLALSKGFQQDTDHLNILRYFDKAFNTKKGRAAWAKGAGAQGAAEYWRIAKIQLQQQSTVHKATETATRRQRKEKEPFEVDFLGPMSEDVRALLEQPPTTNASISLPRAQWRTKGRNLLEVGEGEWVDSSRMGRLWLKPRCVIVKKGGRVLIEDRELSSNLQEFDRQQIEQQQDEEGRKGDYDANFFADDDAGMPFDVPLPIDDDDDIDEGIREEDNDSMGQLFMDAREMLSPPPDGALPPDSQPELLSQQTQDPFAPGSFGAQLITGQGGIRKLKPEYVNYARTAKRVDVKRLKEELWKGMLEGFEKVNLNDSGSETATDGPPTPAPTEPDGDGDVDMMDLDEPPIVQEKLVEADAQKDKELKFTEMITDLRQVYPEQQMKDISTSYCFICLLHLANEKGLVLEGGRGLEGDNEGLGMREIRVRKDESVGEEYVGE